MPRLLDLEELTRQLADLPGVDHGPAGSLVVSVRAESFTDAVQLVTLVATEAEAMNHHPDIDLRWNTVTFTLATHSAGGVTQFDVELAHQILAAATGLGAKPLPAAERVELALDAMDADAVRPFWVAGLAYREQRTRDGNIELQDPAGRGPVLWFQQMTVPRSERSRFHLDVYVPSDEAAARVRACLDAGGRLVTDAHAPSWWVLADVEGNELCVCTRDPEPRG